MSGFLALVWFAANVAMIVFIVKTVKEKDVEQKKQKRKIWLICLAVAFVSLVGFAATDTSSSEKEEVKVEESIEDKEDKEDSSNSDESVAEEANEDSEEKDVEEVEEIAKEKSDSSKSAEVNDDEVKVLVAATELTLKENFGSDNYSISYKDNMVTINVWQDGITLGALGVKAGTVSKSEWNTMVDACQSMSESLYSSYKPYGVDVNVNVLNDQNKDNVLLSFLDGIKFYDCLDE